MTKEANNSTNVLDSEFVGIKFVCNLISMSDKWVYRQIKLGLFPKPIKFGRSSRWTKSSIEEWLKERIEESMK